MPRSNRFVTIYAAVTILMIGFGVIAAWSIGLPFIMLGLVLLAIFPLWERPALYWAVVGLTVGILASYWLVTPAYCSIRADFRIEGAGPGDRSSFRVCRSFVGIEYRGRDAARTWWPAALAAAGGGAIGGTAGALGGRAVKRRRAVASA